MNVSDELVKALADPKPLYALAGAGDLAAEKVKSASVRGPQAFLADLSESVTSLATRVAAEAPDRFAKVPAAFDPKMVLDPKAAGDTLREAVGRPDVQALRDKAQTIALIQVGRVLEAAGKAVDTYDGLAVRGRGVVDRYRGGETPGTEESVTVVVEQVVPDDVLDRQNHEIKVESDIDEAVLAEETAAESPTQPQPQPQSHSQNHSQPHNGKPTPADAAAAARKSSAPRKRATGPKGA